MNPDAFAALPRSDAVLLSPLCLRSEDVHNLGCGSVWKNFFSNRRQSKNHHPLHWAQHEGSVGLVVEVAVGDHPSKMGTEPQRSSWDLYLGSSA